jgi:hypothetical protein
MRNEEILIRPSEVPQAEWDNLTDVEKEELIAILQEECEEGGDV